MLYRSAGSRRQLLTVGIASGAALFTNRGLFADLLATPALTEGPFYPDHLPLDQDNDLLILSDSTTPALGTVTQLSGRVLHATGEYRFRTIKPVPYPGRPAPHIHFKIKRGDRELLTTQLLIRGHEGNQRDGVFAGVNDLVDRELIEADFKPVPNSKTGEVACSFDIVLGRTPSEEQLERN